LVQARVLNRRLSYGKPWRWTDLRQDLGKKAVLVWVILVVVMLTGCTIGRSTADVERVMNALKNEELRLSALFEGDDPDFFDEAERAFAYLADSFVVSMEQIYVTEEVDIKPLDYGRSWFVSKEFSKAVLLDFEQDWDVQAYRDHLWDVFDDYDRVELFRLLLRVVDFSRSEAFSEEVSSHMEFMAEAGWVKEAERAEMVVAPAVVSVVGNSATWMQNYTIAATITAIDDQILTCDYSCVVEIDFVKDSTWKISSVRVTISDCSPWPEGNRPMG
jgi:hypothetical protein